MIFSVLFGGNFDGKHLNTKVIIIVLGKKYKKLTKKN